MLVLEESNCERDDDWRHVSSILQVTKVISPQSVLVDRVPRHIKDLRPQHSVTSLEEDSDGTPSESETESLLCDTEDTESAGSPEEGAVAEPPLVPLHKSTWQKWRPPDCHICDHGIGWGVYRERKLTSWIKAGKNMPCVSSTGKYVH